MQPEELLRESQNVHTLLSRIEQTQRRRRFVQWLKRVWGKLCFWRK